LNRIIESQVIVYHDETKNAGDEKFKGHVLFFVPVKTVIIETGGLFEEKIEIYPFDELFNKIEEIRVSFGANHKFHFNKISGRKWNIRNNAERKLIQTGVDFLRQKRTFCKLGVIFYEGTKPYQIKKYGGKNKKEKELRFEETILRILLKGTVHYLYDNEHKVKILNIYTDGMSNHRKLNEVRILDRLLKNTRDYVQFDDNAAIIHLDSNHNEYNKNTENYVHANMLQLADMLLGSVIHSCLKDAKVRDIKPEVGDEIENKKGIIAFPVKEMLDKRKRGKGFIYSSHYKSFTISKAYINDDKWVFENVTTKEDYILDAIQLHIF